MIFFYSLKKKTRSLYLNSNNYNKRITPLKNNLLEYRPSPSLLDCLIKYDKKRIKIENYSLDEVWNNISLKKRDFHNLNSFFGCLV